MKWISVEDRLPDTPQTVWINRMESENYDSCVDCGEWRGLNWYWHYKEDHASVEERITHWMPRIIPDPPEEK